MHKNICLVVTTIGDGAFLADYVNALRQANLDDNTEIIVITDLKNKP